MGKVKDREFWQSAKYNSEGFSHYYNRLVELATSMFEWKNLPDSCDPVFLELALLSKGQAVFFKDDTLGYLTLRCVAGGEFDVYRIPGVREAYSANGYHVTLDDKNSVIIYNNMLRQPSMNMLERYAKDLAELDNIIMVNCKAQKTPVLITCDENLRLTLLNAYKQYEGNAPVIFGEKSINPNTIKALTTGAPFVAKDIYELRNQKWNEVLTYLGISNVNYQKRERMITDEVTRSQGGTIASRYSRLEARRQACDKINAMFKLDVWCDFREDYQDISDELDTVEGDPNSDGKGGDPTDE